MYSQCYKKQVHFAPRCHSPGMGMCGPTRTRHDHNHHNHHNQRVHHSEQRPKEEAPPQEGSFGSLNQHHHSGLGMAPPLPAPPQLADGPAMTMRGMNAPSPLPAPVKLEHLEMKLNKLRTRMAILASRRRRIQPKGHKLHPHRPCRPGKVERLDHRANKLQRKAEELMRRIAELQGSLISDDHPKIFHKDHHGHHHHHRHYSQPKYHSKGPRCHRIDSSTANDLPFVGGYVAIVDVRKIFKLNHARGEQVKLSTIVDFWTRRTQDQDVQLKLVVPIHLANHLGIRELETSKISEIIRFVAGDERMTQVVLNEAKASITAERNKCLIVTSHPKLHHILLRALGNSPDKIAMMHIDRFHELVSCNTSVVNNVMELKEQEVSETKDEITRGHRIDGLSSSSESDDSESASSDSECDAEDDDNDFEAVGSFNDTGGIMDRHCDLDHTFSLPLALEYDEHGNYKYYQGPSTH